tara:strand:- start:49 stop:342 length:294 start_codon:yes stop_codon:yes gene_type:complete
MVDLTLSKLTAEESVVVAALVPPVKVSPLVNVPVGIVIAIEVALGKLVTTEVAPLVPPVIVSETEKLPLAPTVIVKVPAGYVATSEANVIVVCSIVH